MTLSCSTRSNSSNSKRAIYAHTFHHEISRYSLPSLVSAASVVIARFRLLLPQIRIICHAEPWYEFSIPKQLKKYISNCSFFILQASDNNCLWRTFEKQLLNTFLSNSCSVSSFSTLAAHSALLKCAYTSSIDRVLWHVNKLACKYQLLPTRTELLNPCAFRHQRQFPSWNYLRNVLSSSNADLC